MILNITLKSIPLLLVILLSSACAPGHFLVREADLHRLELRLQEQEESLLRLSEQQIVHQDALLDSHYSALETRLETLSHLQSIAAQQNELAEHHKRLEQFVRTRLPSRNSEPEQSNTRKPSFVAAPDDKQVIGAVEKVFLSPPGALLPARVDTGATTSSLDARDIEHFERNGERWVRFSMFNPEDNSELVLECRLVRKVRIVQAAAEEAERRPVVELGITVGRSTQTAQFTLSDRRHLEYPVLIGRNVLMDIMVVDVSRSHIAPPLLPSDPDLDLPQTP